MPIRENNKDKPQQSETTFRLDPRIRPFSYKVTVKPNPLQRSVQGFAEIQLKVITSPNHPEVQRSSIKQEIFDAFFAEENNKTFDQITFHAFNIVVKRARFQIFRCEEQQVQQQTNSSSMLLLHDFIIDDVANVSTNKEQETITFKFPEAVELANNSSSSNIIIVAQIYYVSVIQTKVTGRSEGFFFSNNVDFPNQVPPLKRNQIRSDETNDNNNATDPNKHRKSLLSLNSTLARRSDSELQQGIPEKSATEKFLRNIWTITTQLEPCNARRICPMMDEPSFRASWQLNVIVPPQIDCMSFSEKKVSSSHDFFSTKDKQESDLLDRFFFRCSCDASLEQENNVHSSQVTFVPFDCTCCHDESVSGSSTSSSFVTYTFETKQGHTIPPHIVSVFIAPEKSFTLVSDAIPERKKQAYVKKDGNNNNIVLEDIIAPAVPISIFVPNHVPLEAAKFPLETTRRVILFIESILKCPLPPPLLQLVPSEEFSSLGMENWGQLLISAEYLFVIDHNEKSNDSVNNNNNNNSTMKKLDRNNQKNSENTPIERIQRIARLIAHETLHQWSGNLCAVSFWNETWLKEGMVRFFEYVCCQHLFPEWNLFSTFYDKITKEALDEDLKAFQEDQLAGFHDERLLESLPVSTVATENEDAEIANDSSPTTTKKSSSSSPTSTVPRQRCIAIPASTHPRVIMDLFDTITYGKAGSVLRMLYETLDRDIFLTGFAKFLCKYSFNHARLEELCECFDDEAAARMSLSENNSASQRRKWKVISPDYSSCPTEVSIHEAVVILINQQIGHATIAVTDVQSCGCCKVHPAKIESGSATSPSSPFAAVPPPCFHEGGIPPPLLVPVWEKSSKHQNNDSKKSLSQLQFWDCRNAKNNNNNNNNNDNSLSICCGNESSDNCENKNVNDERIRITNLCAFGPFRFVSEEDKERDESTNSPIRFVVGCFQLAYKILEAPHIFSSLVFDFPPSLSALKSIGSQILDQSTRSPTLLKLQPEGVKSDEEFRKLLREQVTDQQQQNETKNSLKMLEAFCEVLSGKTESPDDFVGLTLSWPALDVLSDLLERLLFLSKSFQHHDQNSSINSSFASRVQKVLQSVAMMKFCPTTNSTVAPGENNNNNNIPSCDDKDISAACHHEKWSWRKNLPPNLHSFYLAGLSSPSAKPPLSSSPSVASRIERRLKECLMNTLSDVVFHDDEDFNSSSDEDDEEEEQQDEGAVSCWSTPKNSLLPDALLFFTTPPGFSSSTFKSSFLYDFCRHLIEQLCNLSPQFSPKSFQESLRASNKLELTGEQNSQLQLLSQVAEDAAVMIFNRAKKYCDQEENKAVSIAPFFALLGLSWGVAYLPEYAELRKYEENLANSFLGGLPAPFRFAEDVNDYFAKLVCFAMNKRGLTSRLTSLLGNTGEGSTHMVRLYTFDGNFRTFCSVPELNGNSTYVLRVDDFCKKYALMRYPFACEELMMSDRRVLLRQLGRANSTELLIHQEYFDVVRKWIENYSA